MKRLTSEGRLFEALETFAPKAAKRETIPDLFRNIRKERASRDNVDDDGGDINRAATDKKRPLESLGGFITAKQLEECKKVKLDSSQTTIGAFFKSESEVKTREDGKQVNGETSEAITNKMEDDKSKEQKLKLLFGDESDEDVGKREREKKTQERDHKHSKRKQERSDRKRKNEREAEEASDKKHCTNGTKADENGASSSVECAKKEKKRTKLKKSEIGTLVVKLLTPAYAERRFDSRDTFKSTARSISHALLDKGAG